MKCLPYTERRKVNRLRSASRVTTSSLDMSGPIDLPTDIWNLSLSPFDPYDLDMTLFWPSENEMRYIALSATLQSLNLVSQ